MDHAVGATHKWVHLLNQWGCHWQSFYLLLVEAYRTSKYQPNQNNQTISKMTKRGKNEEEIIEEVVNDLDEVKLDDCNVQCPITLVGAT